jgi:mannose/fructose/N-acetylgalactosamine-specific phosphotransferase system component IIB
MVKRAVNSEEDKQKIRLKINEIIVKYDLFSKLDYEYNMVDVEKFLKNIKKLKIKTNMLLTVETDPTKKEDLKKKIEDLEYIEANQFYCKGHSVNYYDNTKKCFDNDPYKDKKI